MSLEIRIVENVLHLVPDKASGLWTLRYSADGGVTWTDIVQIDYVNGQVKIAPKLADGVKQYLGTDGDYSIRYDATADAVIIRDEVNATEVVIPRNQNRNLGVFSKHRFVEETTGVENGPSGSPATVCSMSVSYPDFMTLLPLLFDMTPHNLATGETVTYRLIATLDDGTNVELYNTGAVSSAVTAGITFCNFRVVPDGRRIVTLAITAESSLTSPSSTSTADIMAIELD